MSLRTYPLIIHPAYLKHIEETRLQLELFPRSSASDIPRHRPDIQSMSDIARYLGISPLTVRGLIRAKFKHYQSFTFRKRMGGTREIDAPRTYLKVAQWWILDTILSTEEASPHAFGFVSGRSFVDNARFHLGANHILNVDIKDFFPSIKMDQVFELFQVFGYRTAVARSLAELVTLHGKLPQGAPTSPCLANLVVRKMDSEMNEIASKYHLKFSRYADDICLSGKERIASSVLSEIVSTLSSYGFQLNPSKTRFLGRNQRKEVTGLVLGREGVALPVAYLNSARGWFHAISKNPSIFLDKIDKVRGTVGLIKQVGGRGSSSVIELGEKASAALAACQKPE